MQNKLLGLSYHGFLFRSVLFLPCNVASRAHMLPVSRFSAFKRRTTFSWHGWKTFALIRTFRSAVRNLPGGAYKKCSVVSCTPTHLRLNALLSDFYPTLMSPSFSETWSCYVEMCCAEPRPTSRSAVISFTVIGQFSIMA